MSLIIDGYNLMHAAGVIPHGAGPGGLERSRLALLNFLAERVDEAELAATTVVFDAAAAPPGLPRMMTHRGLTVQFSSGYNDADELIEELIRKSTSPRRLTVVSSDHRLHRAARRRKAQAIDSDVWHAQLISQRREASADHPAALQKPGTPVAISEVEFWLKKFTEAEPPVPRTKPAPPKAPTEPASASRDTAKDELPLPEELPADESIFPQEYLDSIDEE